MEMTFKPELRIVLTSADGTDPISGIGLTLFDATIDLLTNLRKEGVNSEEALHALTSAIHAIAGRLLNYDEDEGSNRIAPDGLFGELGGVQFKIAVERVIPINKDIVAKKFWEFICRDEVRKIAESIGIDFAKQLECDSKFVVTHDSLGDHAVFPLELKNPKPTMVAIVKQLVHNHELKKDSVNIYPVMKNGVLRLYAGLNEDIDSFKIKFRRQYEYDSLESHEVKFLLVKDLTGADAAMALKNGDNHGWTCDDADDDDDDEDTQDTHDESWLQADTHAKVNMVRGHEEDDTHDDFDI